MSAPAADVDLLVLGAGPAGLAGALVAARAGLSVAVLERADHVGGLAASYDVAGVRVDAGSHRLHPSTPAPLLALLRDLLGDDLQTRPRHGRLRLGEAWVGFPLRAGDLARSAPRPLLAGLARDAVLAPLRRPRADTYAEVLRAGLGPTALRELYAPMAEKLWGLPAERLHGHQARVRVTAGSPAAVVRRLLRPAAATAAGAQGQAFLYPRRGFGQVPEALASAAGEAGASVRLGWSVTAVVPGAADTAPVVVRAARNGEELAIGAWHVLSTLPLPLLARLVPGAPAPVREAAAGLGTRAVVLLHAVHRPPGTTTSPVRWTPFDAHYLPGRGTPVVRLSEPLNYRDSADDPVDRSVVTAEIPCAVGDATWTAEPDALADVLRRTLADADLPPLRPPADGPAVLVRRLPHVYPVYDLESSDRAAVVLRWADGLPGVTSAGRLGSFAHDNTHHAMTTGVALAEALTSGRDGVLRRDDDAWRSARAAAAVHRVED